MHLSIETKHSIDDPIIYRTRPGIVKAVHAGIVKSASTARDENRYTVEVDGERLNVAEFELREAAG